MIDKTGPDYDQNDRPMETPWSDFKIDKERQTSLVDQIVQGVALLVQDGRLRLGAKLPSIRQFAKLNAISTFTVVEAYERLATTGILAARRGSGYFVARKQSNDANPPQDLPELSVMQPLVTDLYSGVTNLLPVGASWLPPEWHGEGLIVDAVRLAMRMPVNRLQGYGHPLGFPGLRQHLAGSLSDELFIVAPDQIILTNGSTHAFDLILTTLTEPGDTVFVEDPGYANLPALVRQHHCVPVGIPRDQTGIDLAILTNRAAQHRPKLMFVGTVLQNPLGTSLSHAQAHQLLKLAAEHNFWLVEGDTYREFATGSEPSLAAMDGLQRVIRVGSFSKTLSAAVRVGSIAAPIAIVPKLVHIKMLAGLTTSEINERAVYHAVSTTAYRRMIARLRVRLRAACDMTVESLTGFGLTPLAKPRGGMFVSAGWGNEPTPELNGTTIANLALESGILLSPDNFFTLATSSSIWFRFNVVYADSPQLKRFLTSHKSALGIEGA